MKLFIFLMTVLFTISTCFAVTEYNWPGPLVVPSDGRKAIESGKIRVQLPDNSSVSRHVKVRKGVEVTLDCSSLINRIERFPFAKSPLPATWSVKYYNIHSKTFGYSKIGNDSYSFIISSDKNSQLKIKEVSFTTSARLSFTENSTYTCETCFDEINILTGYILRRVCLNSTSRVQAIGEAPTINRNGELPSSYLRIGQTVDINDYDSSSIVWVVCEPNGTNINPEPKVTMSFNGEPLDSLYFIRTIYGASNHGVAIIFFPSFLDISGNLTCTLSNQFGSDTETTKIVFGNTTKKGVWKTGAWSECTQECGGGRRQRSVTCVDFKTNEELSSSECSYGFKPSGNQPCNLQDCCFDVVSLCSTFKSLCSYNKIKYMCCKTCTA